LVDNGIQTSQTFTVNVDAVSTSKICDSNGCGDSFVGGYLAKLALTSESTPNPISKSQIEAAVKAGNLMAGEVLQRYGCEFPSQDQLKRLLSIESKKDSQ
jgi:sugar/nucleoside kinase (ribokinase family)